MVELKKDTTHLWVFKMVDEDDGFTPVTGASPTVQVSEDGATFAALYGTPAVSQIGNGWYKVQVAAEDMNADVVVLKATATGCAQTEEKFYPPVMNVADLNDFDNTSDTVLMADDYLTSSKIADSFAEKIADILMRRSYTSIRTSSDGDAVSFRSMLGALAMLVNRRDLSSGSSLVVCHEDDETVFETSSITGDSEANPITVIAPS